MSMEKHHDQLYDTIKKEVLKGQKHLPYKEYLYGRTVTYIEKYATFEEVEKIQEAIDRRYLQESTIAGTSTNRT